MSKKILLILNGESGTGKTFFKENIVPHGTFYNLVSATNRNMRAEDIDGVTYHFHDEQWFERERAAGKLATYLFVNEALWQPGERKWLYGVPTSEIYGALGQNLIYDVIQPRYTRELIDWFKAHHLDEMYDFYVAWFLTETIDNMEIAKQRAGMKNDMAVRRQNTCNAADFAAAGIKPDFITRPRDNKPNIDLINFVRHTAGIRVYSFAPIIKPISRTYLLHPDKQYAA